jgi:hypothetical protein
LTNPSKAALDLAQKFGLDPSRTFGPQTFYPGIDGVLYTSKEAALRANMGVESDYTRGASGACTQDPSKAR